MYSINNEGHLATRKNMPAEAFQKITWYVPEAYLLANSVGSLLFASPCFYTRIDSQALPPAVKYCYWSYVGHVVL